MLFEKIELETDEKVLEVVRKHWFVIITALIGTVVIAAMPLIFMAVASVFIYPFLPAELSALISGKVVTFMVILWLLVCILYAFTIWTHYFLDLWIITDRRIIMIDQIHFFNRNVAIFRFERLQDIEFSIKGIVPTLLNFGTLSAQTAGQHEHNFQSNAMPDPRRLQSIIQGAMDRRLKEQPTQNQSH